MTIDCNFLRKEIKNMRYLSVFDTDAEVLIAFDDIYLKNNWFDLDCTYSKGVFYQDIKQPAMKSDLEPLYDDVIQSDSRSLDFVQDKSIKSIVFDPPFLFRNRKAKNNDKMCARFSYFTSYEELIDMYKKSLDCFKTKLIRGGLYSLSVRI